MQNNIHFSKLQILIFYFIMGFFSLIIQAVLLRELMVVVLGNEFIFGIILSFWLLGIYLGALLGARTCQRTTRPVSLLFLAGCWFAVFPFAALSLSRLMHALSGTHAGAYIPFFQVILLAAIIIIPCSFVVGFLFPIAPRLASPLPADQGKSLSLMSHAYMSEAWGAVCAGLLFSFFLAGRIEPLFCVALSGLPLLAWLWAIAGRTKIKNRILFFLIVLLYGLLFFPGIGSGIEHILIKQRWRGFSGAPLLISLDSRYQNLALGKLEGQVSLFANGQLAATFPEENDNQILAAHLFCQHPGPQRILVIGEVHSGLARELLKYNIKELVSVEIDATAVNLIKKHLPESYLTALSDPRFKQVIQDGRTFVRSTKKQSSRFDVVFLHLPEPATLLLNRFYTREFFNDITKILSPQGTLALKITSSENYFQGVVSLYTSSIYHTLKRAFPYIAVAPGTENFLFASRSQASISVDPKILQLRFQQSGVKPDHLAYIFSSLYPQEKTGFIRNALEASDVSEINSDQHPVSSFHFNKILGWYSGVRLQRIFNTFARLTPLKVLLIFLLLAALRLLYVFAFNRKGEASLGFNVLLLVFVVGFLGISLELMIIYAFQILFGYVYQLIGFLIALFMLGLPLGAQMGKYLATRRLSSRNQQLIALMAANLSLGLIVLLLPGFIKLSLPALVSQLFIFSITIVVGAFVGAVFPLALNIYHQKQLVRAAGMVDAADHLGAGLGAILTGALLVPILGLALSGWILFILSLFASVPLGLSMKQK